MIYGILFLLIGAALAFSLGGTFWIVWRGVTAITLLFLGVLVVLINFSKRRADKHYREATQKAEAESNDAQ